MRPVYTIQQQYVLICCLVALALNFILPSQIQAVLHVYLEDPAEGQIVADIGILRGWVFSDVVEARISRVALLIDGAEVTTVPFCRERPDVAAFSDHQQLPRENMLNRSFGAVFNHSRIRRLRNFTVRIESSEGQSRTLMEGVLPTKNPGRSEVLEQIDLSNAKVWITGGKHSAEGATASQEERRMVEATDAPHFSPSRCSQNLQ
jgi:hypothetical protein